MKRFLAVCLTVVMVLTLSIASFAAGGFVTSPSGKPAPVVDSFNPHDPDCTGNLTITAFGDRDNLPDWMKELLEKGYYDISNSDDLTKLNKDLKDLADSLGINGKDLSASDFFGAGVNDCNNHDGHHDFDLNLKSDSLKNFVGLLCLDKNGNWSLVKNAKANGNKLSFTADDFAAFAVIVNTGAQGAVQSPQTGDNGMIAVYSALCALSAAALIVIYKKSRKETV